MSKQAKRYKRKDRQQEQNKLKLIESLVAKTENQKEYIRTIIENDITFCSGPAGSGKTFIAVGLACEKLVHGKIERIVACHSIISCDNDIGAMPGDMGDKLRNYVLPLIEYFEFFLGKDQFLRMIREKRISFMPVEMIRGATYKNAYVILDEAQNCTFRQMKMFLSRIGENSKMIVVGDSKQSDINKNGFMFCLNRLTNIEGIGITRLTKSDILRHPLIGKIMDIFEENE